MTVAQPLSMANKDIFHKALDRDRELVVVRGPAVSPQAIRGLIDAQALEEQSLSVYAVWVEVRSASQPPVSLGTRLLREPRQIPLQGLNVLDVLAGPSGVVIATAEHGGITLWRIEMFQPQSETTTVLAPGKWSSSATLSTVDHRAVSVKLGHSADKNFTVEVIDLRLGSNKHLHTLFEQNGSQWQFERIKQWKEE